STLLVRRERLQSPKTARAAGLLLVSTCGGASVSLYIASPALPSRQNQNRMAIGGEFKVHERQVGRIHGLAGGRGERGRELLMIEGRVSGLLRRIKQHKLASAGGGSPVPKTLIRQPVRTPHSMQHQRRSVVRHEFFRARVIGGCHLALSVSAILLGEAGQGSNKTHHHPVRKSHKKRVVHRR